MIYLYELDYVDQKNSQENLIQLVLPAGHCLVESLDGNLAGYGVSALMTNGHCVSSSLTRNRINTLVSSAIIKSYPEFFV